MKRLPTYVAALALLVGAGAANAADLYSGGSTKDPLATGLPAATAAWTGFYIGANIGYGFDGTRDTLSITHYDKTTGLPVSGDGGKLEAPVVDGVVGGVQLGYDKQFGSFVLGVATDFNLSGLAGSKSKTGSQTDSESQDVQKDTNTFSQIIDWYGTVRARAGVAVGPVLLYGTGGLAYGDVRDKVAHSYSLTPGTGSSTAGGSFGDQWTNYGVQTGYVVGGGAEYRSGNWGVDVSYQYINLGSQTISGTFWDHANFPAPGVASGTVGTSSINSDFHTVKVGLNYHVPANIVPLN